MVSSKECKYKPPACAAEISDRLIIEYGGFGNGYEYLNGLFNSEFNGSVILRGQSCVGKKSLVHLVTKRNSLMCIVLDPIQLPDDLASARHIAKSLKLQPKTSVLDMMKDIEETLDRSKNKVVIVLNNLEVFCRQKQCLLYNLTNLVQHGRNICLVGITISLTCLDNLEKRVRSRLSSMSYNLAAPYSNVDEYIEFASILMGGMKFERRFKEQLAFMYNNSLRSIVVLKKYLIQMCQWNDKKQPIMRKIPVDQPLTNPRDQSFSIRFRKLTRYQQDLALLICFCCTEADSPCFYLKQVDDFVKRHNLKNFQVIEPDALKDVSAMIEDCLFIPTDKNYRPPVNELTKLCLGFTPFELKALSSYEEFKSIKTNSVFRRL